VTRRWVVPEKAWLTEGMRDVIDDAMDVQGGAGICRGPRNVLARLYQGAPIGITVEGANILTRTMIVFGQGALRCHPYAFREMEAARANDLAAFDRAFFGHVGHVVCNTTRAVLGGLTRLADRFQQPYDEQSTHWEHLNLAGIQLPSRATAELKIEDIQYQVLTKDGSRIVWGRAPGTDHPGELSAEQKIGRLTQYLADFGTFRPPHGPLEIDIRHWQEITQRRLSTLETSRN
jgi:hypothetical protein